MFNKYVSNNKCSVNLFRMNYIIVQEAANNKIKSFTSNKITAQKYITLQWIKSVNFIYKRVDKPSGSQENINCLSSHNGYLNQYYSFVETIPLLIASLLYLMKNEPPYNE